MPDCLLEVRTEEIPARMLRPAIAELEAKVVAELRRRGLEPTMVESGITPRRLVLVLRGLPAAEPDRTEELTGPPVSVAWDAGGAPTRALEGFARRVELPVGALERVATERGEYVVARRRVEGRPTPEILAEILPEALAGLSWPKTMRWGRGEGPWVRPVHGVLASFDGETVPFALFGVAAGDETTGHPTLSPEIFRVSGPEEYRSELARRGLEVSFEARRAQLEHAFSAAAEKVGGRPADDPELLDKLTLICEVPGVMCGGFDESFLRLPTEILQTSLRDHQSAFTVESADGELLPWFLTVMDRSDDPIGRVKAGNEWVVAARLSDAQFFHDEDRKRPLEGWAAGLGTLTFHERLGHYAEKTARVRVLARRLAEQLGWEEHTEAADEAARLLKADLVTGMVGEFSSLEGIVGGLYAREEGADDAVWTAIYDQYRPSGLEDPIPRGAVGWLVGLADRLDTLAGMFGLGLVPTGSRDPFGLRRAAQGVVRILLEADLPLDLEVASRRATASYGETLDATEEEVWNRLGPFLADRVRHLLGRSGFQYDEVEAGLAAESRRLPDLLARVRALHEMRADAGFLSVVLSAKRVENILRDQTAAAPDPDRFEEPLEHRLWTACDELEAVISEAEAARDYRHALVEISALAPVLEQFFDDVMVMHDDPGIRGNRLGLLSRLGSLLSRVAGLGAIVVDKGAYRSREAG